MTKVECVRADCCCKCCGGTGDRSKCACPCNKCSCARDRIALKTLRGGIRKKRKEAIASSSTLYKFVTVCPTTLKTRVKHTWRVGVTPPANKIPYVAVEYPKEVEEQTFEFCYDEGLAELHVTDRLSPAKAPRSLPTDKNKGMRIHMHAPYIVATLIYRFIAESLYAHFAVSVVGKVVHVREHMWCMPCYQPENAALSVSIFLPHTQCTPLNNIYLNGLLIFIFRELFGQLCKLTLFQTSAIALVHMLAIFCQ